MKLHRINNILHRDLGYLVAGAAILYAISGLALNHVDHWNPNFVIHRQELDTPAVENADAVSREWVLGILKPIGEEANYRSHDFPSASKLKVYLADGSVFVDLRRGTAVYETVRRRPIFYQINGLHVSPKTVWLVFSDGFAVMLAIVSATGLFVLKGKHGITGRGAILAGVGLLIPLGFALLQ